MPSCDAYGSPCRAGSCPLDYPQKAVHATGLRAGASQRQGPAGQRQAYAGIEAAKTPEELLGPDIAFHRRIAEAPGNDLLACIGNMLLLALFESIKLSSKHPDTRSLFPSHSLPRHKAILTALLNRDPVSARRATLVQLEEAGEDLSIIQTSGLDLA